MTIINTDNTYTTTHTSEINENKLAATVAPIHTELPNYETISIISVKP